MLVVHACKFSYLGGWDQEDWNSEASSLANNSQDPISKITKAKKKWRYSLYDKTPALQMWSPELKP
jgi:hypothetical protein